MNGLNSEVSRSLLDTARALAPRIVAAGDRIEAERRLPEPLVAALAEAGLFKMLLPRSLGGGEADLRTFLRVLEQVATADGSAGWCLAQNAGRAALVLRLLHPDVARRIFSEPRAIIANGTGAAGRATEVEGGYRLDGEWPFASGCTHTTWLMGAAAVYGSDGEARRQATGAPDTRMLVFPTSAARIVDTWQVSGLRGTGSHTVAVTDLFVPHDQTASPVRDRRAPAGPLDAIPDGLLFAAGFSAVTMGIARGALDAFIALAAVKKPRDARRVLHEDAVVQTEVAQAEARLRSARAFLHEIVREAWEAAVRGEALTDGQQVLLRLAATSGIHQAAQVVDTAYHAAGATAIFASNGFERRFRDVHAVTQQAQAQQHHFQAVGQFFLGLGPDDQ